MHQVQVQHYYCSTGSK